MEARPRSSIYPSAIGVDLNADHLAVAETDAPGNPINSFSVLLVTYGNSSRRAEAIIGDAVANVVECAREVGKPIVIKELDFRRRRLAWRVSPAVTAGCCPVSVTARSKRTSSPGDTGREWKYIKSTRPSVR